ncbi:hypothetical protein AB0C47_08740 [Micromonospora taraxaci]|uniref:hypothetical protein n=1 Tax=Micromonospora taraxaci TaxID=1316803 RepID=UPI0033F2E7E9
MTTDGTTVSPDLIAKASAFADDITSRLHRVVRTEKNLSALLMPGRNGGRVMVGIVSKNSASTRSRGGGARSVRAESSGASSNYWLRYATLRGLPLKHSRS